MSRTWERARRRRGDKAKIFTFKDTTPQEASGRCLRRHQYTEEHGNYDPSMHLANCIGCIDCHSPLPAKESRLSTDIGANLSGVTGNELNVNPLSPIALAPAGPLNSNWYQPYGAVSYRFSEQWTGRARWDYYGYHGDPNGSYQDLFAPRNFHGNLITLSVRYAF